VNPSGTFVWSRDIQGGVNGQPVFATAVTFGNGDIYVGGDFSGSADFRNGGSVTLSMLANTSATNGFVASIGTNGNWVWASRTSGAQGSEQYVYDLAVGPLGTIAVSGAFLDNNQFWTNATFGSFLLARAPGVEGFVAGLDAYGNWVWADGFGGEKDDISYGVAWLGLGRILTGGRHCVDLSFGCGSSFGGINKTTYSEAEGAGFVWVFEVDTDYDTVPDLDDNCPTVNNTDQADMDGDNIGDLCDSDADADNLDDYWDDCIGPTVNWNQSIWINDRDGDGSRILKRMTMMMVMASSMVWMIVMITQPNTIGAVVLPTITILTGVMMRMKTLMMTATLFSMSLMPARGTHTIELGLLLY
tara:strand:- start:1184 stop:2260 length:1077 start_codon:yes stop_codon:yes gene_type:complete